MPSSIPLQELPSSPEVEQAILGAMLLDKEAIDTAVQHVRASFFSDEAHATLFQVIVDLFQRESHVDPTTVITELQQKHLLDKVRGPQYVLSLPNQIFAIPNVEHYIKRLRADYERRELLRMADQLRWQVLENSKDVNEILEFAERRIFDLALESKARDFLPAERVVPEVIKEIEERRKHDVLSRGVRTGYVDLDEMTGGFQPSDLIILAARPAVGKTAFAMNMALNIGIGRTKGAAIVPENRRPVGVFSLEMSAEQIMLRLLSCLCNVSMSALRHGILSAKAMQELRAKSQLLAESPIYIDDTPNMTVMELRSKARRLKSRVPELAILFIDYLQLMHSGGKVENRQQEVAEITRSLKGLARELNIPIVALSQLGRQVEQRKGKKSRPVLSDLRESGAIEQDADVVLFIHRDFQSRTQAEDAEDSGDVMIKTELIIGKHRNGPTGTVELYFWPKTASFLSVSKTHGNDDMTA